MEAAPPIANLARASIRLRVLVATALLAACGLGFAGISLRDAMRDHTQALALQATSAALATLSRATIELSLERSASQLSIEMHEPVTPDIRTLIDQQRAKADAGLDLAVKQAASLATATRTEDFIRNVTTLRNQLGPIRQEFDRLNAMPPAARAPEIVLRLPRDLKAVVVAFQAQRHLLRGLGFLLPTEVAILETVRDQSWQIREFGGRERTYLAVAAATRERIRDERLEEMAVLARRASDAWLDITELLLHAGLQPGLSAAAATLGQGYFGSYDALRTTMLAEARKPIPGYPPFATFFARSSEALAGAEALAAAASVAIDAVWTARAAATLQAVVVSAACTVLLLLAGLVCAIVTIGVFRRLDALRSRMQRLATGDATSDVPDRDTPNEVGAMARAVLVFRETARERQGLEDAAARTRAAKDRSQSATEQHMRDFTESLAGVMRGLSAAGRRMDAASVQMAEAAARTGDLAHSTTQGATDSARDLVTVATATEQLSASVVEISQQVARAATTAHAMTNQAGSTEQTMAGLSDSAGRVSNVARLIGDIAGQTNLLALNATIEAARAGEAGKGFAVVAAEVKQLAARTSAATGEIASHIESIQATTQDAVAAVRQMAAEIRQMEEMAAAIAAAVEQQGAGVRDIAGSIASVTRTTETAVAAMGESVVAAEAARTTSTAVREAAANVGHEADTLGKEVEHFLTNLAADRADLRQYERTPGHDVPIEAILPNGRRVRARLMDISQGGLALCADEPIAPPDLTAGTQVTIELPGASAHIPMRVVRIDGTRIGLVARQDTDVAQQLAEFIARLANSPAEPAPTPRAIAA